jgi:hypothetical protein
MSNLLYCVRPTESCVWFVGGILHHDEEGRNAQYEG